MSLLNNFSFNCFRHPTKKVQTICTEPFCNYYRFFCIQCFLDNSSHLCAHKQTIHEINDVLESHQNSQFNNAAVSELQQGLMRVKMQMKEYENIIKSKHASYIKVIDAVEQSFQQAKNAIVNEIEDYLTNLVAKQQAHFQYLENKMKLHVKEASLSDLASLNRQNENEVTNFFENIIKSPLANTKEFQNEVNFYVQSFRRNIHELDNLSNTKMVTFFTEELNSIFKNKFNELKQLLVMSAEDLPLPNTSRFHLSKINNQLGLNGMNGSSSSEFKFKYYRTPSSTSDIPSLAMYNNTTNSMNQNGFSLASANNQKVIQKSSSNGLIGVQKNALYNGYQSEDQNYNAIEIETNQILDSSSYSTILPKNQIEKNPLHTAGICTMIVFQENSTKKIIVTGSLDYTIKFWQLESSSFDFIKTIRGHTSPIYALQKIEKENNIFLASGSADGEIRIWNPILQGKELLATFNDHQDAVMSIIYNDDFLISGSADKTVKVWNLDELFCTQTLNQDQPATSLCTFQNESLRCLVSACGDGFRIWNQKKPGDYKLKSYNNKAHKKGISIIAAIGSSNVDIATAGKDGLIKLWNIEKGMCVNQLQGHTKAVYQLYFSHLNNNLYSCSADESIKVWDLEKQTSNYENGNKFTSVCPKLGEFIVFDQHNFILTASNDLNIIKIITMSQ
ncbi:WD domain, G-beta repeat protein (macronuclear) [Tetrahymena thermophila SB210]|uniref:WD domain, G-beta repeat protein n=1 Tax=Tetrahymena thermophila (strain SB210) TaxID=312017 RepID=Q247R1_TETTS|nr:WD domain, G-beta repeat protein [Tetrahymena thermophila SB210]EAS04039.1 WD domain, G-beta repeat protein [Tetrahymena thermophila SB210]|eukprot:XP_001024284.1 WD domain, G-beta repeat protein [Tetrahymena thermophila SB210]